MKKRSSTFYEILLAIVILACILVPRLLGTTMVYEKDPGKRRV